MKKLLIFLSTLVFILGGTYLMIRYAQGYRPTKTLTIRGTGLLSVDSFPTGAQAARSSHCCRAGYIHNIPLDMTQASHYNGGNFQK